MEDKECRFWDWFYFPWFIGEGLKEADFRDLSPRHQALASILFLPALALRVIIGITRYIALLVIVTLELIFEMPIAIIITLAKDKWPSWRWAFTKGFGNWTEDLRYR